MNTGTENTTTTTTTGSRPTLSVIERIELTSSAWRTHAPEAKFASKNWAEFRAATEMSRFYRSTLVTLKSQVRGGIAARCEADKATRAIINRVIAGVKGDASFGPDSALYRGMGLIPLHERKRPGSRTPESAAAPKAPRAPQPSLMERLAKVRLAWSEIAPGMDFSGISLAQFDEAVAPSHTTRVALATFNMNHDAGVGSRDGADEASLDLVRRVVSGIKADEAYGTNSPLYRALGYRTDSERRSARRSAPAAATTPEAPAQ